MPRAFPEAFDFVEQHRDHLGVADPDTYVAQLRVFMDQRSEDAQAAATIAVGAAKNLINIGVAFFVALGAFALTSRSTHATSFSSISVVLLSISALATRAYQAKLHAPEDGRLTPQQIEGLLGTQSQ